MAKSGNTSGKWGRKSVWITILGLVVLALGLAAHYYREPIQGYAGVSTSYAARVACSCRFVAGRDLEDCAKDKLSGMEMVSLSENPDAQSVTASIPFVNTATATNREGYGCVLESWEN